MEEASTQAKNKAQHYKEQAEDKANDYKNQAKDKVERKLQEGQQYATNKMNEGKVTFHVHSVWSIDDFYFLRFLSDVYSQNDKKQIEDTTSHYKDQAAMRMNKAKDSAEAKLGEVKVAFIHMEHE
jgi:hypothetical protein